MRYPDSIQVLLRVRRQREEVEERRLAAIVKELKLAQIESTNSSVEVGRITSARLAEIQSVLPNTHHQAVEERTRALRRRSAELATEIERLEGARSRQMSNYLLAKREREIVENLNERHLNAIEMKKQHLEQKLNEDLFLGRRVAKWDKSL